MLQTRKMSFILLVMLISYLSVNNGEKILERSCRQNDNLTITCNNIPSDIPKGLLKFRLNIETSGIRVLNSSTFKSENWSKLKYLEVTESEHTHVVFEDNCFNRLKALRELHIHVWYPQVFRNSFSGLLNVKTLDMNGCGRLTMENLRLAIKGSKILPGLNKIFLSYMNLYRGPFAIDSKFVELLLPRNITHIDVSTTQISEVNITVVARKLLHLDVFNASYAKIGDLHDAELKPEETRRLKVLDLSHVELPYKNIPVIPVALSDVTFYISDVRSVDIMDIRNMFGPETVNLSGIIPQISSLWLHNVTLIMDDDLSIFTKNIKLQQNNLKRMDFRLICDTFDLPSVQVFDIADNGMEFVHPKSLSCFRNLRSLDLSKNQLFKMVDENSALFQNLIQGLNYLKVLRMSANGLHNIPNYLFQNSQSIEEIDLSDNTLDQVTFILRDLENLKVLDLQGNNIHFLDPVSIHHLNSIPRESNANTSYTVILTSNPILCSVCDAKPFLQWLLSTYHNQTVSQRLTCLDENSKYNDINSKTVEMVQAICHRTTIYISASVLAAVIFLFSIFIVIAVYTRYKQKQRIKNRTNVINNLRDGEGQYQFAVFLSFSNLDEEFVNLYVLNKLNENLQLMTGIDRTLVCTGDQHFRPGFNVHDETFRLLDSASVLIVVVSNHFLTSDFCQSELDKAYEDRKSIVLMLIEQVDPDCMMPTMKALYQNNTRILWKYENGEYVLKTSWENACKSILDLISCET